MIRRCRWPLPTLVLLMTHAALSAAAAESPPANATYALAATIELGGYAQAPVATGDEGLARRVAGRAPAEARGNTGGWPGDTGSATAGSDVDPAIERPGLAVLLFLALAARRLFIGPPRGRRPLADRQPADDE